MTVISMDEHRPLCLFCYGADTQMNWVSLLLSHLVPQTEIPAKLECSLLGLHLNSITPYPSLWKTKSPSESNISCSFRNPVLGRFYPPSGPSSCHDRSRR